LKSWGVLKMPAHGMSSTPNYQMSLSTGALPARPVGMALDSWSSLAFVAVAGATPHILRVDLRLDSTGGFNTTFHVQPSAIPSMSYLQAYLSADTLARRLYANLALSHVGFVAVHMDNASAPIVPVANLLRYDTLFNVTAMTFDESTLQLFVANGTGTPSAGLTRVQINCRMSSDAQLYSLMLLPGAVLVPPFNPSIHEYSANITYLDGQAGPLFALTAPQAAYSRVLYSLTAEVPYDPSKFADEVQGGFLPLYASMAVRGGTTTRALVIKVIAQDGSEGFYRINITRALQSLVCSAGPFAEGAFSSTSLSNTYTLSLAPKDSYAVSFTAVFLPGTSVRMQVVGDPGEVVMTSGTPTPPKAFLPGVTRTAQFFVGDNDAYNVEITVAPLLFDNVELTGLLNSLAGGTVAVPLAIFPYQFREYSVSVPFKVQSLTIAISYSAGAAWIARPDLGVAVPANASGVASGAFALSTDPAGNLFSLYSASEGPYLVRVTRALPDVSRCRPTWVSRGTASSRRRRTDGWITWCTSPSGRTSSTSGPSSPHRAP